MHLIDNIFQGQGEQVRENPPILISDGIPLGAEVSQKIKAKIWEDEYLDLRVLLPNQHEDPISVTIESHVINFKQGTKSKSQLSIYQWTDAFHIFTCIYLEKYPNEAANLLKYCSIVRDVHKCADDQAWRSYDESFRRLRQTSKLPWQKPVEELRMKAISGIFRKTPRDSFRNKSQSTFWGKGNKIKFCFAYNKGERCSPSTCQYLHACSVCRNNHPKLNCKQTQSAVSVSKPSNQQAPPNSSKSAKSYFVFRKL
ncbi:hypothetical protein FSP39_011751 [Pinctada imbricata]|uniref:C3H1-type domain-containing protein n=1 Tax=Pinctada imbricata TaxID=66713 RepID=A0AA88YKD1_PINIB|nr:hypothetical protein FSP39_011751 [Pinctada imbricata]